MKYSKCAFFCKASKKYTIFVCHRPDLNIDNDSRTPLRSESVHASDPTGKSLINQTSATLSLPDDNAESAETANVTTITKTKPTTNLYPGWTPSEDGNAIDKISRNGDQDSGIQSQTQKGPHENSNPGNAMEPRLIPTARDEAGGLNPGPRSNWRRGVAAVTAVRRVSVSMGKPEVGSLMKRMSAIDVRRRGTFLKVRVYTFVCL